MSTIAVQASNSAANWPWRLLAAVLILGSAGLRVFYLAQDCPLDLAPDEAHYWDWSRHLDWSYYSKGPLVAYLIRLGCEWAGPWSQRLTHTDMLAVRLPAVVCGSLLLVSLYVLTVQVFRRERLAAAVVAIALTLPLIAAGSAIMTIDSPYTCCWGWACVLGYQAVFRGSWWAWPAAGLVVGLGILAKYTMVLWLPSVGLFLFLTPAYRSLLFRSGFWAMSAVAAACCLPMLIWNLQHDWVTLRHVGGQAGVTNSAGVHWFGPLAFVGVQFALLLGFWFVVWASAMIAHRPRKEADPGVRYLWCLSAFMFCFFWAFSLRTSQEPNWPVTAYVTGMVLAAAWLVRQLESPRIGYRRVMKVGVATACGVGLVVTFLIHRSDLTQPLLLQLAGPATEKNPIPLRRFDPTCRLRGWRYLASEVDWVRESLREQGIEPVLVGSSWTVPGELGFYCQGNPTVHSIGLALGDRRSQYDFWGPNPVWDKEQFLGRTMICVGGASGVFFEAFEQVDMPRTVVYREQGQPVAEWTITICRGFRGFPQPSAGRFAQRY